MAPPNYVPLGAAGLVVLLTLTVGFGRITEYREELQSRRRSELARQGELAQAAGTLAQHRGRTLDVREEYFRIAAALPDADGDGWELKRIPRPDSEQVVFRRGG